MAENKYFYHGYDFCCGIESIEFLYKFLLSGKIKTRLGSICLYQKNDNFDYTKNWSIIFTEATWELLNEWLKDNREHMIEWDKFGSWGDVFDKIGSSYERIWSDEELKQGYLNN